MNLKMLQTLVKSLREEKRREEKRREEKISTQLFLIVTKVFEKYADK